MEILDGSRNGERADVSGCLGDCFERLLVFVEEQGLVLLNGPLGVERYPDVNVCKGGCVPSNIFEKEFWFCEVEALCIYEFRVWIWKCLAQAHLEEAVDDDEELWDFGGKSSTDDSFLTLATDFRTEALAWEHGFRNCSLPNCDAPV